MVVGQNRRESFRHIEDKMVKRVQDWKHRLLSWADRECLIKAGLNSISLYSKGCFKFPLSICNNMTALAVNFWWSGSKNKRAIHWIRKDVLLKEKLQGGMGFRCFECLNVAMLMKQFWRVLSNPDSLVSKTLSHKYFRSSAFFDCKPKSKDSYV